MPLSVFGEALGLARQRNQVRLRLVGFHLLLSQVAVVPVLELVLAALFHLFLDKLPAVAVGGDELKEPGVFLRRPLVRRDVGLQVIQVPFAYLLRVAVWIKIYLLGRCSLMCFQCLPNKSTS